MANPNQIGGNSSSSSTAGMIRNISQTTQEREIIKTAPDVVIFMEGLPYLINPFVNDPRTGKQTTLVNFNDHVTSFSATYDTDAMVPNCTVQLQVPNYEKYLYQMPGGNNLLQTMAQIQVYAKGYYMSSNGDTVYRRVFKGVTSNIGYNDNGRTLEISVQCQGILYLLEKMMTNIHPSVNTSHSTGVSQTIWQSKYASGNAFEVLDAVFLDSFRSDMFQIGSLQSGNWNLDPFKQAVERGYMAKWQAILWNMVKDVHIFGPYKDTQGKTRRMKKGQEHGNPDKNKAHAQVSQVSTTSEKDLVAQYQTYYGNIEFYFPFRNLTALDLKNSVIVNRLDIIREVVQKMDYEAYQDVDGKIIIKPPLYNLDVVNLGTRTKQTQTNPNSSSNNITDPATAIYETNNPFVVYLSEILTEQETEDQGAIRRTRTTVCGNVLRSFGNQYDDFLKQVGEYIDISKLAKFGLREEPMYQVPWIQQGDKQTLFVHAAAETARANRGYRTYTFTIPMRPELKLGFPVYIPHKDMYCYIKNISLNFQIGATATMTVTCDSIRRRVYINTTQTGGSGNSAQTFAAYTPAPNLVYQWTKADSQTQLGSSLQPNPSGSQNTADILARQDALTSQGTVGGVSSNSANPSNLVGTSQTLSVPFKNADGSPTTPTQQQLKLYSVRSQDMQSKLGNQYDTPYATYVIKNDGDPKQNTTSKKYPNGFFVNQLPADGAYIDLLVGDKSNHTNSVMPFTDGKGYEVIAPFPWGRYADLNTAVQTFTQAGWLQNTAIATQSAGFQNVSPQTDFNDLQTLQNTDAFLFAGLGTPSATGDPASQLIAALNKQSRLVGGSSVGSTGNQIAAASAVGVPIQSVADTSADGGLQKSESEPDATVIVLHYSQQQAYGTAADKGLLNAAQPEDKFAAQLLPPTSQTILQSTVDVLVSGSVSPSQTVKEALLAFNNSTQTTTPQNVQKLNSGVNQPSSSGNIALAAEQAANFNSIKGGQ
jgi:hypothetical protein